MPILALKKYAKLIKWGGIVLVVVGISYSIYDYSKSKQVLSQMIKDNMALETRIDKIKTDVETQMTEISVIRSNYKDIEYAYSVQLEEIDKLRDLTNDYIKDNRPEVQQELNTRFSEQSNKIQCLTGDKSKCGS